MPPRAIAGYDPLEALKAAKLATRERHAGRSLLRIVKLTALFLFIGLLQLSAGISGQRLSISVKNTSLDKLFNEIEKKTSYVFFYDASLLQHTRPVTVDMRDATVEDVLAYSLKGQGLAYSIQDRTIFVKREAAKTAAASAFIGGGATPGLSGVVKSEEGLPLAGATVYIRKLKIMGVTDAKGEFELKNVPDGEYEVEISYVGFEALKTTVTVTNHEGTVTAKMKQLMSKLDETVVKGYYTTTNRLNTGDVTTVKGEVIQQQPVSDPIMALEGRVPGLYIQQNSGIPGANMIVRLRGQNSILNGNDPLYIVDGVPFSSVSLTSHDIGGGALGSGGGGGIGIGNPGSGASPFNNLNPADIERIEVLKDADATAIYGSRGANGVILITTRRGKAGDSKFDINVNSGEGKVTRTMHLMNTQQYLQMRHQAFANDGKTPGPRDYDINGTWDSTRNTDWQKVLTGGTAHFTNAQASFSGGDANTQFVVGGGYSRQTTVYPGSFADQKASLHFNINHISFNQRFHVIFTGQYVNDNNSLPSMDFSGLIKSLAPDAPPLYNSNGSINWQNGTWTNPIATTRQSANAITKSEVGNLNMSYEVLPGLQLRGSFGYTYSEMNQNILLPGSSNYVPSNSNRGNEFATSSIETWIIEPQINYSRKLGQGKLEALIGSTLQENSQSSLGQVAIGFASDALIPNISAASTIIVFGNQATEYHYAALFSRLSYTWKDKYLLNLTARRDGSSRFGPSNEFGSFGAIGAGWVFSKESFVLHSLPFLSFGKLRVSYGTSGNDQIKDYQYLSAYSTYSSSSYQSTIGLYPNRIANPYYGWEVVKKVEGGIELGFINDRILVDASYYRDRTGNQLVGAPLPSIDGFTSIQANLPAVVQNSGGELEINTVNIRTKKFSWTTSVNVTVPRNKLVSFPGLSTNPNYQYNYALGKSIYTKFTYRSYGVDPQKGIYTFEDVNHDGVINTKDRQFLKQVAQTYFGGFQNSLSYKQWRLDIFFQFVKQTALNYVSQFGLPGFSNYNQPTFALYAWQKSGDITKVQQYSTSYGSAAGGAYSNLQSSDAAISDASFIRLKNVALSYTLPVGFQNRIHLKNARLYVQGQNLFTITQYKGLDPETQGLQLPSLRMIIGGIQLGL